MQGSRDGTENHQERGKVSRSCQAGDQRTGEDLFERSRGSTVSI